jgi:SAM-dependent methyltransferase
MERSDTSTALPSGHVCPAWAGPLLCCPLRRLFEKPETLLGDHVRPATTILEPGCGMGYFTLPLARITGPAGKVVAVDLQPKMIEGLRRRARRAGLLDRIDAVACTDGDLGLARWSGLIDLTIAIHVLHEVRDRRRFLEEVFEALRPGGRLLLLEPKGHVSREALDGELALAEQVGFHRVEEPAHRRSHGALLEKPGDLATIGPSRSNRD